LLKNDERGINTDWL